MKGSIKLPKAKIAVALGAILSLVFATTSASAAYKTAAFTGTTINVLVSSGHQQFNDVWLNELPKFEAQSGMNVNLIKVGTTDILATFLRDVRLGGCTIDNVSMLDGGLAASSEYMADLGPYLAKDGSSSAKLLATQVPFVSRAMVWDGKLKFYPYYSGSKGIAYRVDLFNDPANQAAFLAKYKYKLPIPPVTPQQLLDVAKFFTTDKMKGIVFSGSGDPGETTLADTIFRSGIDGYQDANGNALYGPKYPANQKIVTTAATWLTNLIATGLTPNTISAMQTADSTAYYVAGKSAMLYDHIYLQWSNLNSASAVAQIGKSGSFEMPNFSTTDGGGIPFYWARGIPNCSKNKDASWAFTKWITSDDILKNALTKGVGVFVPTKKDILAWAVAQNIVPTGVADAVKHAKYYRLSTVTNQLRQVIDIPLVEKLIGGQLSPNQYTTQAGYAMQQAAEASGLVTGGAILPTKAGDLCPSASKTLAIANVGYICRKNATTKKLTWQKPAKAGAICVFAGETTFIANVRYSCRKNATTKKLVWTKVVVKK
jgi:multiple sugar transport system substrate-binding protein